MIRKRFDESYDWGKIEKSDFEIVSNGYLKVIQDTRDFCTAKNIRYLSFLQPVQYYSRYRNGENTSSEKTALSNLYHYWENEYSELSYAHTLTPAVDANSGLYLDECHLTTEGNRNIANEIATVVSSMVNTTRVN